MSAKKENTAPAEKKPRTIDPAIAELRAIHKSNVAKWKAEKTSSAILARITDDLLPKLTDDDKLKLRETLR